MIIGSNGSIVSQLFTDFAEPLGLYESQLTILHASDHRDAQLVADIWNALLLRGQFCRTTCDRDDTDDRASSADVERSPPSTLEVKPAPLNVGRSNTTKKANGWFRWGKGSVDDTPEVPAGTNGHDAEDEYDPYR